MKINNNSITDVPGIKVGHAQNLEAATGCTVILTEAGATGGVDQRGGAPGTRETDALRPMHLVEKVHGVILSGGSAFGLDAAGGVMKYLEEKKIGVNTGFAKVPIVPSAILFDLGIGNSNIRPDAQMGYEACQNATVDNSQQGNVGAGTGATVGKNTGDEASHEIWNWHCQHWDRKWCSCWRNHCCQRIRRCDIAHQWQDPCGRTCAAKRTAKNRKMRGILRIRCKF